MSGVPPLMGEMGRGVGAEPEAEVQAGRIAARQLLEMAERCTACTRKDDCLLWLVEERGFAEFCPNADVFRSLMD